MLAGCTIPDDQYDYVVGNGVTMTASTLEAGAGDAVTLTFTGGLGLDEKSRVSERKVSGIRIGMCFTRGLRTGDDEFIEPHGFCFGEPQVLPANYRLLDSTDYYTAFDDVAVGRGEERTFEHSFTFTSTKADELTLIPTLWYTDEPFAGPRLGSIVGGDFPVLTFR